MLSMILKYCRNIIQMGVSRLFSCMKTAPILRGIVETGGLMQGARRKVHQTTPWGVKPPWGINPLGGINPPSIYWNSKKKEGKEKEKEK